MTDHDFCTQLSADDDVPFDDSDEEDNSSEGTDEESSDGGDFDDDEEDEEDETDDGDDDEDDGREDSAGKGALKAAMSRAKKWPVRKGHYLDLTVSFIGGSPYQRSMVKKHAPEWQQGTGVRFIFQQKPGKIRVAFVDDGSSWSKVGTDALTVTNKRYPTMNFGWIDQQNILHEFGHALGLQHEHSSPSAAIPWDKEKVYRFYRNKSNWTRAQVDNNILNRYNKTTTNYTKFDPNSIMLYTVRGDLLKPNSGWRGIIRKNTLSSLDKSFMAKMYPRPGSSNRSTR